MDLIIEILIKDKGIIDINTKDIDDFGIPLTFNISEIKDFASRRASFSKTIKVLGSKNNNKIFNYLYEIKGDNFTYDMTKRYDCVLLVNKNPVMEGYVVLKNIEKVLIGTTYQIIYEVVIFDQNKNFFETLEGKTLQDLDFSSSFIFNNTTYNVGDHNLNEYTIDLGLFNKYDDVYTYGLVDYGYYTQYDKFPYDNTVNTNIMYPHVYLKAVLDKIFYDTSGYTYDSSFFDGDTYSNMINNMVLLHHKAIEYRDLHNCEYTTDGGWIREYTDDIFHNLELVNNSNCYFSGLTIYPYELSSFNYYDYGGLTGTRVDSEGEYNLVFRLDVEEDKGGLTDAGDENIYDAEYKISKYVAETGDTEIIKVYQANNWREYTVPIFDYDYIIKDTITGLTCDRGDFFFLSTKNGYWTYEYEQSDIARIEANGTSLELINIRETGTTADIVIGDILPDMTQSQFLKNLINMFNLYIYTDKTDPNKLIIEPRDDFYKLGDIINWTNKVDYNQNIKIESVNNLISNRINFSYKLGDDHYSQEYYSKYIETYGDKEVELDNPYLKEEYNIELDFQSYMMENRNIGSTDDIQIPILYEEDNSKHTIYDDRIDFEPMVGFKSRSGNMPLRMANYENLGIRNAYANSNIGISYITHAKMLGGYSFDLNYETGTGYTFSFSGFDPTRGLYNIFWENYINDLIDDSSRMVIMYINLSLNDIISLNFRNRIYIDGQVYYLQKIEYDPSNIKSSKVMLMKEIDPVSEGSFRGEFLLKNDSGDYILTSATNKILIN